MKHTQKLPLFLLTLPLLLSLACGFSIGDTDSESENTPENGENATEPTAETSGTIRTIPTQESGQEATSLPAMPSSSSEGDSSDDVLVMHDPIFIQEERNLITTFLFENTDPIAGIEDIEYNVTVTDASGNTLNVETGYIDFINAGSRIGVASQMYLNEGEVAEGVDIDWIYYMGAEGSVENPFTFENSRYYFDPSWDRFTAVMTNNSSSAYTNVRVDVIAYDAGGVVIGGGFTYVDFVPGNDQVGVSINGYVSDDPASFEFFPRMGVLSNTLTNDELTQNLNILQSGFFYNETTLTGGFLVENTSNQVMKDAQYYITIYETDGTVAQTAQGYINSLWPGQTYGISPGNIQLSEGAAPSEFNVYLKSGTLSEDELDANPLTAQNVTYLDDPNYPKVSLTINNAHSEVVDSPYVTVLLFNAEDEIIGGNYAYPDPIPANGSLTYEIYVTLVTNEPPVRIEAYPTLTSW